MTRYIETPIRPYNQDWPGLNTRGGRTMRIGGEMEDCTNVMINEGDILAKRSGFIRGLDEQFDGVVCGLFAYTDDCGGEWLLVADEFSIKIRQPYTFSSLQTLDCYPFDAFEDVTALDPDNWRNTSRFSVSGGQMQLASALQETTLAASIGNAARWFKEACSASYQVTAQFAVDTSADQRVVVVIRGRGDLTTGGQIVASLLYRAGDAQPYTLSLVYRDDGGEIELGRRSFSAIATGFMSLRYNATTRVASIQMTVSGGGTFTLTGSAINAIQDAELGFISAIGLSQVGASLPTNLGILQVSGSSF